MDKITDALGCEIVIGETYASSRNHNGIVNNFTCRVLSVEDGDARVEFIEKFTAIYSDNVEPKEIQNKTAKVKANTLIKI